MNLKKRLLSAIAALAVGFTMFALPTSAVLTGITISGVNTLTYVGDSSYVVVMTGNGSEVLSTTDSAVALSATDLATGATATIVATASDTVNSAASGELNVPANTTTSAITYKIFTCIDYSTSKTWADSSEAVTVPGLTSVPATVAGVSVPFGTAVADVQKALPTTITGVQTYASTGWVNTDSYSDTTAVGTASTFTLTPAMASGYKLASGATITCEVTVAAAGGGSTPVPNPDSPGTSVNEKTDGTTEKIVDPSSVLAALINGGDAKCEIYTTTGKDGKTTTFSVKANKNTAANIPTADELRKITEILKTLSAKPTKEAQAAFDALVKSDKNKDVKGMVISFADHGELNFDLEISMPVDTSIFKDGTTHDLYYFNPKTGVLELVGTSKIVGDKAVFTLNKLCVYYLTNTKMDLSAGEGVAVTTEAIATTAAVAETTAAPVATTPATNPTTGNAPIALALIPVAAIAAFVLAKKSK